MKLARTIAVAIHTVRTPIIRHMVDPVATFVHQIKEELQLIEMEELLAKAVDLGIPPQEVSRAATYDNLKDLIARWTRLKKNVNDITQPFEFKPL